MMDPAIESDILSSLNSSVQCKWYYNPSVIFFHFSDNFKRSKLSVDELYQMAVDLNYSIKKFDIMQ